MRMIASKETYRSLVKLEDLYHSQLIRKMINADVKPVLV